MLWGWPSVGFSGASLWEIKRPKLEVTSIPSGEDGSESMELYLFSLTRLHIEVQKHRYDLTCAKCSSRSCIKRQIDTCIFLLLEYLFTVCFTDVNSTGYVAWNYGSISEQRSGNLLERFWKVMVAAASPHAWLRSHMTPQSSISKIPPLREPYVWHIWCTFFSCLRDGTPVMCTYVMSMWPYLNDKTAYVKHIIFYKGHTSTSSEVYSTSVNYLPQM